MNTVCSSPSGGKGLLSRGKCCAATDALRQTRCDHRSTMADLLPRPPLQALTFRVRASCL